MRGNMTTLDKARVIAMDVSGTFGDGIRGALVASDAEIVAHKWAITPRHSEDDFLSAVVTMAGRLADRATRDGVPAAAIGLAVPGIVDEVAGIVHRSPNLLLKGTHLREVVEDRQGLPTFLVQDTRAGLIAESLLGAGRGAQDVLFVTIGGGVGSAIMSRGVVLNGAHGAAGEIGHISVDPQGVLCGCGGRGCLETFASEPWLANRYTMAAGKAIPGTEVIRAAASGDAAAVRIWNEAIGALGWSIGTAAALLDCELVLVAGTVAAGSDMLPALRTVLKQRIHLVEPPVVKAASVGDAAGMFGAAAVAFDRGGMPAATQSWRGVAAIPTVAF
jgi:glucokinase